ncbi:MAG: glycosyltransferase, partial [Chloroflexi bacterium]|nr:glycosyltransferase [Chloroflexota bacterium]
MTRTTQPINALWVIPNLAGGGAERAVTTIITHLDQTRVRPTLCLYQASGVFLEEARQVVEIINLDVNGRSDPRLIPRLSHVIKQQQPDVTIGVLRTCGIITTLAHRFAGKPGKLIINEQNTPSHEMQMRGGFGWKRPLLRHLYRQADAVLAISQAIHDDLHHTFTLPSHQIPIIHNPVHFSDEQMVLAAPPHPWLMNADLQTIVSIGRLHPQKGHDLLIQAFAQVQQNLPKSRLIIVGEGSERATLTTLIQQLNQTDSVALVGFQNNPAAYLQHASLFALASRYEGFGIVLAEAMLIGVPIVATDCPGAPRELLQNGRSGLLVPSENIDALANGLHTLLLDTHLKQKFIKMSKQQVAQFAAPVIANA